MLSASGFDYVLFDDTNLGQDDRAGYVLQYRPDEVLLEQWAALRAAGFETPSLAVWNTVGRGTVLWQRFMRGLYNNVTFDGLIMRAVPTGSAVRKKVFFVVHSADNEPAPENVAAIERNDGRNDTVVVAVWVGDALQLEQGLWTFFAPCVAPDGRFTTNVLPDRRCGQMMTVNSPIGTQMSASFSYQLGYGSLAFQAAGKLNGLTIMQQIDDVLASRPAYLLVPSFNEHSAGPQSNPFGSNSSIYSAGLEYDPWRADLWVDTYGSQRARSFEPTLQEGDWSLQLLRSCIRVVTMSLLLDFRACLIDNEPCCNRTNAHQLRNLWSLERNDGGDRLVTASEQEMRTLTRPGGGWRQLCHPVDGPTDFCVDHRLASRPQAIQGPFVMQSVDASGSLPGHGGTFAPVYRCLASAEPQRHFIAASPACNGVGSAESLLGFAAQQRSSTYARSLRSCFANTQRRWYHTLDGACEPGDTEIAMLGFVV